MQAYSLCFYEHVVVFSRISYSSIKAEGNGGKFPTDIVCLVVIKRFSKVGGEEMMK